MRRVAGEDVEHAGGQPGAAAQLCQRKGRQRRLLGWLQDHLLAGSKTSVSEFGTDVESDCWLQGHLLARSEAFVSEPGTDTVLDGRSALSKLALSRFHSRLLPLHRSLVRLGRWDAPNRTSGNAIWA